MTDDLRDLARQALQAELQELAQVRVNEGMATVSFVPGQAVTVPLEQLVISEGVMWVRVPAEMQTEVPLERVHVQLLQMVPSGEMVALQVDELDVDVVNALMAEYSAVGDMDTPLAAFAVQAVSAALRGHRPSGITPPDETLG